MSPRRAQALFTIGRCFACCHGELPLEEKKSPSDAITDTLGLIAGGGLLAGWVQLHKFTQGFVLVPISENSVVGCAGRDAAAEGRGAIGTVAVPFHHKPVSLLQGCDFTL